MGKVIRLTGFKWVSPLQRLPVNGQVTPAQPREPGVGDAQATQKVEVAQARHGADVFETGISEAIAVGQIERLKVR